MKRSSLDQARESLRLQQVYNVMQRYAMDMLFDRGILGTIRRTMQRWIYGPSVPEESLGTPVKVRLMLQELGPTYVKMGQIVSSQSQVLPLEWAIELNKLQADVPPFPSEQVHEIIVEELGAPPEELFDDFDTNPLAAASTAQVHRAKLPGGQQVVVKVQRPGIRSQVKADLGIMQNAARVVERRSESARDIGLVGMLEEFGNNVLLELDYNGEAYNARRLAETLSTIKGVHVPTVYRDYSTSRVLTMEFIEGVKISNLEAIDEAGLDREKLAGVALRSLVKQLLIDGFFHADPHPGNVLVNLDTGVITYLDTGMMGELTIQQRMNLIQLLMAVRQQDVKGMAQIMMSLSKPFREVDEQAYRRDFERRVSRYMEPGSGAGFSGAVNVSFDLLQKHGLRLDPELTLAIKALLQAEVIATSLYPGSGITAMGFEMTKDLLVESVTADKIVDMVTQQASLSLREVAQRIPSLQEATIKWLDQYQKGRFEVYVDTSDLSKELKRTRGMGRQAIIAVVLVGMIIGSAIAASFSSVLEGLWSLLPRVALIGYAGSMVIAAVLVLGLIWRMIRGTDD